jgi:hypothetical protein
VTTHHPKPTRLALLALLAASLACNMPARTIRSTEQPTKADVDMLETPAPVAPEPTATSGPQPAPTTTPTPAATATPAPTATETATPTPSSSSGPLGFEPPSTLDSWRPLPDGAYECTIILQVSGGAPPYTVSHDVESFTTSQKMPSIVFRAHGTGALVHTIKVESADGQTVEHAYWIKAPWK